MRTILLMLGLAWALPGLNAAELLRRTTLTDGQQLFASDLHNLVDTATIGVGFFNDQAETPLVFGRDYVLVEDPSAQMFRRVSLTTLLYSNTNLANYVGWYYGANLSVPYTFNQAFQPWLMGTNYATNLWGASSFPITSLSMGGVVAPTLTDTDTVPVLSMQQGTNTAATLGALFEYFTNKNTLPTYTQARIQFSGLPATLVISNDANTVDNLIHVTTNSYLTSGNVYPATVSTNGSQKLWAGIQTNTPYWIVPTSTNAAWARVYPSYSLAATLQATNALSITSQGNGNNKLFYVTNFSGLNADAFPVSSATLRTGVYDIYFRSNAIAGYYVTGVAMDGTALVGSSVQLSADNLVGTSFVRISTSGNAGLGTSPRVQVSIQPQ